MNRFGFNIGLVGAGCILACAGSLEVKPLGQPFRAQKVNAVPVIVRNLPTERIWQMVQTPTIDAVTGQVLAEGSRANTVIFDNTVNDTGYFVSFPVGDQFGDVPRMTNGGALKRVALSIFNGDETNKLLSAKVKVVFYRPSYVVPGTGLPPVLIGSFTTAAIDFTAYYPGGMPYGSGVFLSIDTSAVSPPIVLPQVMYAGYILKEIASTPGPITTVGQAVFGPPVIGTDRPDFWHYSIDGTGIFTRPTFAPVSGDFYYKIEVDPLAYTPPPIYSNITYTTGYGMTDSLGVLMSDDLACVPFPAGEVLDRIDFSIFNGSTAETLNRTDLDIVLRDWDPANSDYYPPGSPTHAVVLSLSDVQVDLPPSYAGGFYVSGLKAFRIVLGNSPDYCDLLAGIRFYNVSPLAVTEVGQLIYNPPTVGGSEDRFKVEGGPYGIGGWHDFGGFLQANFYWALATATPYPAGDMNCDGAANGQDIDGFLLVLFAEPPYDAYYAWSGIANPPCNAYNGDMNGDGNVNGQDIDGFVAALFAQG